MYFIHYKGVIQKKATPNPETALKINLSAYYSFTQSFCQFLYSRFFQGPL